jgi:prepilin-type processing-associated H-X9-DG protein
MFAEVKRGFNTPATSPVAVANVASGTWDGAAANDQNYFTACNAAPTGSDYDYVGLQYYRAAVPFTAFYTHTVLPNATSRDCVRGTGLNKTHLAARSYHNGGVNMLLCDGATRFVSNGVSLATWKAVGTRSGSDTIGADFN